MYLILNNYDDYQSILMLSVMEICLLCMWFVYSSSLLFLLFINNISSIIPLAFLYSILLNFNSLIFIIACYFFLSVSKQNFFNFLKKERNDICLFLHLQNEFRFFGICQAIKNYSFFVGLFIAVIFLNFRSMSIFQLSGICERF